MKRLGFCRQSPEPTVARVSAVMALAIAATLATVTVHAELTRQEATELLGIKAIIDQAAQLYKQEKYSDCADQVARAQDLLAKLDLEDPDVLTVARVFHGRLSKAHQLLSTQGVSLPALAELAVAPPRAASRPSASESRPSTPPAGNRPPGRGSSISFTKDVAPILVARCGGCHIRRSFGEFRMTSFASIMTGSENGAVIVAGDPDESVLTQLVSAGEMPPPRPRPRPVPRDEVQVLADWIAQGAKFDGDSENDPLLEMVPEEVARAATGPGGDNSPDGRGGRGRRAGLGRGVQPQRPSR